MPDALTRQLGNGIVCALIYAAWRVWRRLRAMSAAGPARGADVGR